MVQRFKAALVCGRHNPDNPEKLLRDNDGDYVLYRNYRKLEEFIKNGVEYGYIAVPDKPDPARKIIDEILNGTILEDA